METDKTTVDFEVLHPGVLAKILVPEGTQDIVVGTPVAVVVDDEEAVAPFVDLDPSLFASDDNSDSAAPVAEEPATPPPAAPAAPATPPSPPPPSPPASPQPTPTSAAPAPTRASGERVFASPLARRRAAEGGIDLSTIGGSGPRGRVTASDVEAAVASGTAGKAAPGTVDVVVGAEADVAARFAASKKVVPHYYLTVDVDVSEAERLCAQLSQQVARANPAGVCLEDMVIKAAACAMRDIPDANASWMGSFVRQYDFVDVCFSTTNDAEEGATTVRPVVRDVQAKGLAAVAADTAEMRESVATGVPLTEGVEVDAGTFSIYNMSSYGLAHMEPIIAPPQACALAYGEAQPRVLPVSGEEKDSFQNGDGEESSGPIFQVGNVAQFTLSCDHRVVDGAVGAQWLKHFKGYMEDPATMLL